MALLLALETGMCLGTFIDMMLTSPLCYNIDDIVRADVILAMIQEDSKATQYEDVQVRKGNPKRGRMIHMRGTHMMES